VRPAGVEPATLGLEVLRTAEPVRLTFHLLRSETARSPECIRVRGVARRRVSLVTVSVTGEESPHPWRVCCLSGGSGDPHSSLGSQAFVWVWAAAINPQDRYWETARGDDFFEKAMATSPEARCRSSPEQRVFTFSFVRPAIAELVGCPAAPSPSMVNVATTRAVLASTEAMEL
jgi:hypothetical protein